MVDERGPTLLALARSAIAERLGERRTPIQSIAWLEQPGASFVSIHLQGTLRGCVGSLSPQWPLRVDVEANAVAAAFQDSRFAPLSRTEFLLSDLEVSLLSPLEELQVESEAHLLASLRPGVDGLVFDCGWRRSTFLPQVWEQLPDPKVFLAHLKQKAGLPTNFWTEEVRCSRYTVAKWAEKEPSLVQK